MLGKLVHLSIDAILISAFLAGVKRTTGLTPALSQVKNKDVRSFLNSYLEFGEPSLLVFACATLMALKSQESMLLTSRSSYLGALHLSRGNDHRHSSTPFYPSIFAHYPIPPLTQSTHGLGP
ncbi:DUF1748-domain-containing protein [Agrocybe pediades]|nr:DUF1748-domain-containing protein [Agrocybe pediades]